MTVPRQNEDMYPAAPSQGTQLGATLTGAGEATFLVWAPSARTVEVHLVGPEDRWVRMEPAVDGYFRLLLESIAPGQRYNYRLNQRDEFPDPTSRFQPEGVHGPSQVVDSDFSWTDTDWKGIPLSSYIFYELHVGAFTPEGTFEALIGQLDYLLGLGITAIELMPVAQFPGDRNWGYDGVYPFAVQNSYGGPSGLKRFVDAAHRKGLAVVLDVVYNHLGPEGNYLSRFGPYFTDRYHTPWGMAVNFDGEESNPVRRFVIENALRWVTEFHIDALRLDAVHAIFDHSPHHILQELAEAVHARGRELGRSIHVIPESDLNDARLVEDPAHGGYGLDAQWSDDFHHALHVALTGEQGGYYADFGNLRDLSTALSEGFIYSGRFSKFRGRHHGTPSAHLPADRFVVCAQNHDQVGNRMLGERLSALLDFEQQKLAAGVLLLSPFLPLLFMGEEYGETAPFQYFVSHSDPGLIAAVREGRAREFAAFAWKGDVPDPQADSTFERSRPDEALRNRGRHGILLRFYQELIRLRKRIRGSYDPQPRRGAVTVLDEQGVLAMPFGEDGLLLVCHFGLAAVEVTVTARNGTWEKVLDSADSNWAGTGSRVPAKLQSNGKIHLDLSANSILVLQSIK